MNLKDKKYLLLDLDGVCYGSHNGYPLEKVFGMVSKRMTLFIQNKLDCNVQNTSVDTLMNALSIRNSGRRP